VAKNHVIGVVQELVGKEKYDEALKALDSQTDLLAKKEDAVNFSYIVYDAMASGRSKKKEWQGAVDVYAEALKKHPKDSHLTNNALAAWDEWAKTFFPAKQWGDAIKVYENALKQFPDVSLLKNNLNYCQEQAKK
jgi:tetratricopeptide (TPR) repeat protein